LMAYILVAFQRPLIRQLGGKLAHRAPNLACLEFAWKQTFERCTFIKLEASSYQYITYVLKSQPSGIESGRFGNTPSCYDTELVSKTVQ
ncbi:hypothetical protein, partial [Gelidibacter salicanalis]|uniref:hypothetical protein n=1 Tax=Gelidibacter salicanalis TaxID=291193 RepID=UPI001F294DEC